MASTGPDGIAVTSAGLWEYDDGTDNFYERHDGIFRPIDSLFGWFAPHEAIVFESPDAHTVTASADLAFPLGVTRNFDPSQAMIKMGPAYFDVLYAGAGVLFSDYEGTPELSHEDGWIGVLELGVRGAARLTDNLYIIGTGYLFYLPFEDRFGFNFAGSGAGGTYLRVGYEFQTGPWDWFMYDQFQAYSPFHDLFENVDEGAIDQSGRYRFGLYDTGKSTNEFFEEDNVYFVNEVGVRGTAPVFNNDWRVWTQVDHRDIWKTMDFDDHLDTYHAGVRLGYEGDVIPFSPYVSYDVSAFDNFDRLFHHVMVGGKERISENLTFSGTGGYVWSTGKGDTLDSYLWSANLYHTMTERTSHSLGGGQTYNESLIGETAVTQYLQYQLSHRLTNRVSGNLFGQYGESEVVVPDTGNIESLSVGARLNIRPWDFSLVTLSAFYQEFEDVGGGEFGNFDRWVYRAAWQYKIFSRTYSILSYQFEDYSGGVSDFDEHLFKATVRVYF